MKASEQRLNLFPDVIFLGMMLLQNFLILKKISGPLSKIELALVGRILMKTNCLPGHKGQKGRPSKKRRI